MSAVTGTAAIAAAPTRQPTRPFIVGVDGSDAARRAAEWAADVAAARGAPVRLVHAVRAGATGSDPHPSWLREMHDDVERAGVSQVQSRVVVGSPTSVLLERSLGAGMVVVGSYGEGARSGMMAGATALTLLEEAQCPVAVVRGATPGLAPPRRGPVVVGADLQDTTAVELGAGIAEALGASLSVVYAWDGLVEDASGLHLPMASDLERAAREVARLTRFVAPVREAHPGLGVDEHVVDDTVLGALLEQAEDARVVVVGHRRGSAHGSRLGSTAQGLVAFAPCPVVVSRAHRD